MTELILASTSAARRALMDGLGLPYRAMSPAVDESVPQGKSARDAVLELSKRKALAVLQRNPGTLVLGADQLVDLDGRRLGKPGNRAAARAQLKSMAGRTHEILTGVCLVGTGPKGEVNERRVEVTRMHVYPLSDEELERYLELGEWEGCAGSYRAEGRGQVLFERIEGDRTNVYGLPMTLVVAMLRRAGVRVL
jgi:septum formation protein